MPDLLPGIGSTTASSWRRVFLRPIRPLFASAFLLFLAASLPHEAFAQSAPEPEEPVLSRSEWLLKVEESRRRIEQMRREGRSFVPPPQTDVEVAKELSKRVVEDESLRSGDIVSTDRGLLIFKGQSSRERSMNDFVPFVPGTVKP